jgi:UDP-glucuronate 4-epimerase
MNPSKELVDGSVITCAITEVSDSESSSVTTSSSGEDAKLIKPHVGYKKVLVTGGAGCIGSHVAEFLLECGDNVVIVDVVNDYYDVNIKEANLRLLTYN